MHLALNENAAPLVGQGPDLSWLLTVVAILLATILGVAWAMRKVVAGAWRARASKRALRVVDVLPLGGRRQLAIVRCYDRTFALGLGDKDVSLVAELDPDFVEDGGPVRPEPEPEERERFEHLFEAAHERMTPAAVLATRKRAADALARAEQGLPTPLPAERRGEGIVA